MEEDHKKLKLDMMSIGQMSNKFLFHQHARPLRAARVGYLLVIHWVHDGFVPGTRPWQEERTWSMEGFIRKEGRVSWSLGVSHQGSEGVFVNIWVETCVARPSFVFL